MQILNGLWNANVDVVFKNPIELIAEALEELMSILAKYIFTFNPIAFNLEFYKLFIGMGIMYLLF